MTFYEAAVEVLRRTGRPLHFKKITEVAIRDNLLSHVGKTPEVTMGARLDQEVKRQNGSWIVKTRPGVFMLRDDVLQRLNEEAKKQQEQQEESERKKSRAKAPAEASEKTEDGRDEERGRRRRRRRGRGRNGEASEEEVSTEEVEAAVEELEGARYDNIAEAAYAVLRATSRTPMTIDEVAKVVFDKKLVRFHTHDPAATVQSAIVTDNQVRAKRGKRPLFAAYNDNRWGLTEWGISEEGIKREKQIQQLAEDLRREAVSQLGDALVGLKAEAFEMVVMTLLERLAYKNLKVSKRTSDGDVFFTADWRRGFSDLRVCIQIVADAGSSVDGDTVRDLRETLNHYSAAEGVVIHLGDVTKDAVRDSRSEDKAKITIIDRKAFVRLLVEHGIGVKTYQTPVVMVDSAFIDALKR